MWINGGSAVQMTDISVVIPSLAVGGAERALILLAEGFAKEGLSVDLIACEARGELRRTVSQAVRLIDLESPHVAGSVPALVRYMRCHRPKAVLSAMDHVNVAAAIAVKLSGVNPVHVPSVRNVWAPRWRNQGGKELLLRETSRWSYARAGSIVTVAADIRDELVYLFGVDPGKITVIHNPVDIERVRHLAEEEVEHAWFGDNDTPLVVAVGALTKQKNHATLLSAIAAIQAECSARVMIVGAGPERDRLLSLAKDKGLAHSFELAGLTTNPYKYMTRADLFVLPSAWEGCPNVLLEALALGVPVIATDCMGASAELLGYGEWGTIVPNGDASALADAVRESIANRHVVPMSERLRRPPSSRASDFTLSNVCRQYLDVMSCR